MILGLIVIFLKYDENKHINTYDSELIPSGNPITTSLIKPAIKTKK